MSKPTSEEQSGGHGTIELDGPARPRFVFSIRVGWSDCDPAQIAYTGRIPYFALEAIDAWWKATTHQDWYQLNIDKNIGTPFVHMSIDFRFPVTPRHSLECEVDLIKIGDKSVRHRVRGRQDGKVCFVGEFVAVFVEAGSMKTRTPPQDIIKLMQPMLCSEFDRTAS